MHDSKAFFKEENKMNRFYCDRCGKEVNVPVRINIKINTCESCIPNIFDIELKRELCQKCWDYIRDEELSKAFNLK